MPEINPERAGKPGRQTGAYSGIGIHELDWSDPSDDSLVMFVDSQVLSHNRRHIDWCARAQTQLAWLNGWQLKVWDEVHNDLVDSGDPEDDSIRIVLNRLKGAVLNWISMITARSITFRVAAATPNQDDISAARLQDQLARYYFDQLLGPPQFLDALWWEFATGVVFARSTWDPLAGDEYSVGDTDMGEQQPMQPPGAPETNGHGFRNRLRGIIGSMMGMRNKSMMDMPHGPQGVNLGTGDLKCDILSGFDVIPPKSAKSITEAQWLITRQYKDIEEIRSRYGEAADGITGQATEADRLYQPASLYSAGNERNNVGSEPDPDKAVVYELWRPRRRWIPNGYHAVLCQGKVLTKGSNPYRHGEIPLVRIQELPSPDSFWPPSTIHDLMPIQAEINITHSQIAEHKVATVTPRILAEQGIGLAKDAFRRKWAIEEVRPGKLDRVKPWPPEALPSYVPYWLTAMNQAFEDISRNHSPSYGRQTGTLRSGKQVLALQEGDARSNETMMKLLRYGLSHLCRQWMSILHQFVDEERVTRITGEMATPDVVRWSKADLPDAPYNVTCDLGPPIDRSTTLELIDMLTARGWLVPTSETDKAWVYKTLGEGVSHQIDESLPDRMNANVENEAMLGGQEVEVVDGDDDTVHIQEHDAAMKLPRFRTMIRQQPEIEAIFDAHKRNHERARITKQVRQEVAAIEIQAGMLAASGMVPPGAGGPAGEGGGPGGGGGPPGGGNGHMQGGAPPGSFNPPQSKGNAQGQRPFRARRLGRPSPTRT